MHFHFNELVFSCLLCIVALLSDYIHYAHGLSTVDTVRRGAGFTFSSTNGSSSGDDNNPGASPATGESSFQMFSRLGYVKVL